MKKKNLNRTNDWQYCRLLKERKTTNVRIRNKKWIKRTAMEQNQLNKLKIMHVSVLWEISHFCYKFGFYFQNYSCTGVECAIVYVVWEFLVLLFIVNLTFDSLQLVKSMMILCWFQLKYMYNLHPIPIQSICGNIISYNEP